MSDREPSKLLRLKIKTLSCAKSDVKVPRYRGFSGALKLVERQHFNDCDPPVYRTSRVILL